MEDDWKTQYRIPSTTVPLHYDLYLFPEMEGSQFTGSVTITIDATTSRSYFVTHVKYLMILQTKLMDEQHREIKLRETFEYSPNEFWVVIPETEVPSGKYFLFMEFEGRLDNGIVGFYRSTYVDRDKKKSMVSSKFQPTYARRAFPCFDEPSFKSTFSITLVKPCSSDYVALSNMPMLNQVFDRPKPGFVEVNFEKSVPMVTYLVVFVISDYGFIEKSTSQFHTRFRVYGAPQNLEKLEYSLALGSHITDYYESYFGIKYPLPKLDMVAIPEYPSGATEHWGLVTYRETSLMFDEKTSSDDNRLRVANVVAHELAHQWFGNLVTVAWWDDLWLNEGFASYIQFKGIKSFHSEWDTDSKFLTDTLHDVLDLDATIGSHPILVTVKSPDEITSVFDAISYNKGASIIRMMESFLGSRDFRIGISNFLKKYSFKTAVTRNLLDELSAASSVGLDIPKIMSTWTEQKGYPVLTIKKEKTGYRIVQERFLKTSHSTVEDVESPFNYKWEIPVSYIDVENNSNHLVWFHKDDPYLLIETESKFLKFNVEQRGYYRINYPCEEWKTFGKVLSTDADAFSISDKTGLLNDAFALARSGRLDYATALNLAEYLSSETNLAPWETVLRELFYFNDVFPESSDLHKFEKALVSDLLQKLGWDDVGTHDIKQLRKRILRLACEAGDESALDSAKSIFLKWYNLGLPVAPNLRPLVYEYGMKQSGTSEVWKWLLEKYVNETDAQKKTPLLIGLASVEDSKILSEFIQLCKDDNVVRTQDYFTALSVISSKSSIGESLVWDFLRNEWDYLVSRFSLNDRLLGRFVSTATSKFSSRKRLMEMKTFFENHPESGAGASFRKIAVETIEHNIDFIEKYHSDIQRWLTTKV